MHAEIVSHNQIVSQLRGLQTENQRKSATEGLQKCVQSLSIAERRSQTYFSFFSFMHAVGKGIFSFCVGAGKSLPLPRHTHTKEKWVRKLVVV